jgi:hypothetical protein
MNYIGTDPREGMALIAETTASNDSAVNFDGVFNSNYDHYFIEIIDCDAVSNDVALEFSLRNGGSAISGSTQRGKWWGFTDTTGGSSAHNGTSDDVHTGVGNDTGEGSFIRAWIVPYTANEKVVKFEAGIELADGTHQFSESNFSLSTATLCDGIGFEMSSNNINGGTFRIYGLNKALNGIKSINQSDRQSNFVTSNYIGDSAKTDGQGWVLTAESTASDDDSTMEFQNCFSSKYDMYKITVEDMRPKTDKKNLLFKWMDDSTTQDGTYQTMYWYEDSLGQTGVGLTENQATAILSNNTGTDGRESATGTFYCNPMSSTINKWLMQRGIGQLSSDNNSRTRSWKSATSYASTSAYNGIRFYWSGGNFESGKVRIYGKQK